MTTFDMDENGAEASSACMTLLEIMCCASIQSKKVVINSPFSFALLKKVGDKNIPIFYGLVSDFSSLTLC